MNLSEIATYDESGKARKKCPTCPKFVHARSQVCACGHEFKVGALNEYLSRSDLVKVLDKGGRGRKQCSSCKSFVGVRTFFCNCGHRFPEQQEKEAALDKIRHIQDPLVINMCCSLGYPNPKGVIYAPSGTDSRYRAWIMPKDNSYEEVVSWANDIFYQDGYVLSPNALKYILRHNKRENCLEHLNNWLKTLVM